MSASTINHIPAQSSQMGDLEGYKPKPFSPTVATAAVQAGFDEHTIMNIGRWKCGEAFREHYVHNKIPVSLTDKMLKS